MGSAASLAAASSSSIAQEYDPSVFPKHGIKLSFYEEFINSFGGRDAFEGLTTNDVCEKYIKPTTALHQVSFCDLLQGVGHPAVGTARVFISHAWKYQFLDVCDALLEHFRENLDIVVWFDLFVVNQHKSIGLPFDWWTTTFQSAIRQFGHTVMVLAPWNDPIPLTRAWCLWELYSAVITDCKFEIAFSVEEQDKFFEDIGRDPDGQLNQMMAKVNVERSECFKPEDRTQIFAVIESTVGFNHLNSVVFERLRKWVIDSLEKKLADVDVLSDRDCIILSNSIGSIYRTEGQLTKALPHIEKVCKMMEALCGNEDVNTNNARAGLAAIYLGQGDFVRAAALYDHCLEVFRKTGGEEHPSTIATMQCLAALHQAQGDHAKALPILESCLAAQCKVNGTKENDIVITTTNNLANAYIISNELDKAIVLLQENLEISRRVLGNNHPTTLMCIQIYAKVFERKLDFDQSLPLFEECLEKCKMVFGIHHQQTLGVMGDLAAMYKKMQREDKAIAISEDTLQLYIESTGEDHPSTLTCMHNLCKMYIQNHQYEKALVMLQQCYTKRKVIIGEGHPWTLQVLFDMGYTYEFKKDLSQAKQVYTECLQLEEACLGSDHEETIRTRGRLAALQ